MALEYLVQLAMPRAQDFNFPHLLIVSLVAGEKPGQPGLELFIRMDGSGEQFSSSRA
jgi:hypothetical protein